MDTAAFSYFPVWHHSNADKNHLNAQVSRRQFNHGKTIPVHKPNCNIVHMSSQSPTRGDPQSSASRRSFVQHLATVALTTLSYGSLAELSDISCYAGEKEASSKNPKVFFDISVAGKPKGRITIALDPNAAPASSKTFAELASGSLRDRTGRTAGYNRSVGSRVVAGKRVYLGRLNQIDALNQSPGTPQRQQRYVAYPVNGDENNLIHDHPGAVSVSKGGSFEFSISASADPDIDPDSIIIGYVVDGMDVVEELVKIPTNKKTIRDGYRNIGKAIGDPRANVQLEDKPLQKILVTNCGVL